MSESEGGPGTQIKERIVKILQDKRRAYAEASREVETPDSESYHEKPALDNALRLGSQSAIAGLLFAGLRNALAGKSAGFVGPIGLFTAVGATFAMTESVVANQRQTNDAINGASGACASGFLLGLRTGSLPMAVGTCALMGGMMGLYDYTTGGKPEPQKRFFKPTAVVEAIKA
ncbi:hypothetical protein DFH07DRAFT_726834 [Mycena maculata]|uniref:NADH dehydrogenase [ubiquinone] 1 alpha subcomplex subunit 11 n=1 Tax=Mycena maculata TaxID=230809 RepID=A0AAD7P0U4_9AGAR|nr:hypothetical protein DFH07DRAFT_726834 [Mycena maculata]